MKNERIVTQKEIPSPNTVVMPAGTKYDARGVRVRNIPLLDIGVGAVGRRSPSNTPNIK